MPFGRFLWVSVLALGCSGSLERGRPCPTLEGGPLGSGSSSAEAGATGGRSAGGAAGSGSAAANGGASAGAGGVALGGSAGTGASGAAGTGGSGGTSSGGAAAGGATSGTGGGGAGGASGSSGGASGGGGTGSGGASVPSYCADGRHDGDETDVDCGGSCSGCGPGSLCRTDSDCGGLAVGCGDRCYCDTATSTCVYNDCYDNKTDALETDFDCGGPLCHPCELGSKCVVDADCVSAACDA